MGMIIFVWSFVLSLPTDAIVLPIAAWAPSIQVGQTIAMGPIMIFIFFSGFIVSRRNGPIYLKWFLEICPMHLGLQAMYWDLYGGTVTFEVINLMYGYEEP